MADFVYTSDAGGEHLHKVTGVTSVQFAPAHVVFRHERFVIFAAQNDRVHNLRQVDDPAEQSGQRPADRSWVSTEQVRESSRPGRRVPPAGDR